MSKFARTASAGVLGCFLAGAGFGEKALADCASLLAEFNAAVQARAIGSAKRAELAIGRDAVCGGSLIQVQNTRAALQLVVAEGLPANSPEREELLIDADQPDVSWKAATTLGALRFQQRRFAEAATLYLRAIELVKNPTKTPRAPDADAINQILDRAGQMRLLAANEETPGSTFVASAKDHRDGGVGGVMSEDIRGIRPVSVPLPIRFDTNSADLSSIGREAIQELVAALKEQKPPDVILVGHTDSLGSDDYNMKLSAARIRTVERALREGGVTARIRGMAKGKSEPIRLEDKSSLTQADINALNRRVEWRRK